MFEEDRLILANVLCQIFLKSSGNLNLDAEFNYILRATSGLQKDLKPIKVPTILPTDFTSCFMIICTARLVLQFRWTKLRNQAIILKYLFSMKFNNHLHFQGFTNKQVQAIHTLASTLEPFKDFVSFVQNNSEEVLQNVSQISVRVFLLSIPGPGSSLCFL